MSEHQTWKIKRNVRAHQGQLERFAESSLPAESWQITLPDGEVVYGGLEQITATLLISALTGNTSLAEGMGRRVARLIRVLGRQPGVL